MCLWIITGEFAPVNVTFTCKTGLYAFKRRRLAFLIFIWFISCDAFETTGQYYY
jgi:hypothetical protein